MSRYRTLADAATPRPWRERKHDGRPYESLGIEEDTERGWLVMYPTSECGCEHHIEVESESDLPLMIALVNNADAIERLWKAADGYANTRLTDEWNALIEAIKALEPLFGEQP